MIFEAIEASEAILKRGGSVNPAKYPFEMFELLSIPAYDSGQPEILSGSQIGSSKIKVEPHDVLLSKIVPHIRRCWVVPEKSNYRQIASGEWIIFRHEGFYPEYLKHFLTSDRFHCQFMNTVAGVGGSLMRARPDAVGRISIPVPSLGEQKRIAAILDKADAIRRKRQQAIQLADQFLRSVFLDLFGDLSQPYLTKVSLGDVTSVDAKMVDPKNSEYLDLLHIGPDRIEKETGRLLPARTAREDGLISNKFLFDERYVLYSKIRPYLNKCALAVGVGLCSADMYPIRPKKSAMTREFLWMLLLSGKFNAYIASLPGRANIPKLNRSELGSFEFRLPDLKDQEKFSVVVRQVNSLKKSMNSPKAKPGELFGAISQKAFAGEL